VQLTEAKLLATCVCFIPPPALLLRERLLVAPMKGVHHSVRSVLLLVVALLSSNLETFSPTLVGQPRVV